jgi:hypothetical protein
MRPYGSISLSSVITPEASPCFTKCAICASAGERETERERERETERERERDGERESERERV